MDKKETPNYWAVLPANVRYDNRLRPAARLLYCEISSLSNKYGVCTAGNTYFARLYGVSKKTVEVWVKQLKDCGYIRVEVIRDEANIVLKRKIWMVEPNPYQILEKEDTSPPKYDDLPLENYRHNNTSNNNIPPISPTEENEPKPCRRKRTEEPAAEPSTVFADYAGADSNLLNTLLAFESDRALRKRPMTENAKLLLCKRLDKLAETNAEKIELLEHAIVMAWDSVYPMRDRQKKAPAATPAPRRETREL